MLTWKGSRPFRLFVIGFMGSGKSTVGRILAERLSLPFLDLDLLIEKHAGVSVPEIFKRFGEETFRKMERECLRLLPSGSYVVATGGGIVEDRGNVSFMRDRGVVVFLYMGFEEFLRRKKDLKGRPLLEGPESVVRELFFRRLPLYRSASDITVVVDGKTPDEVADEVLGCLSLRKSG